MTNALPQTRPLLASFEEEIPEPVATKVAEYDEARMILLVDGAPALLERGLTPAGGTRITRVGQETVDDD